MNSSSSKKSTSNYTSNYQLTDQSFKDSSRDYEDSFNTYIDAGAIEAGSELANIGLEASTKALNAMAGTSDSGFEFAKSVIGTVENVNTNALVRMQDSSDNAMSLVSNLARDQDSVTVENVIKYLSIGFGLIGLAWALRTKKNA